MLERLEKMLVEVKPGGRIAVSLDYTPLKMTMDKVLLICYLPRLFNLAS